MKTVLVTGPIGGGKSTVCRFLESCGYPVYDCDSRTKGLYESVPGLKSRIERELDIRWDDIRIIFKDEARRLKLESIVYPLLARDILEWKREQTSELAFIESAVAMDKPVFDGMYDSVLLVRASLGSRMSRNPAAAERNSLQSFDEERVGYIIDNDSTIENLQSKTKEILCRLI